MFDHDGVLGLSYLRHPSATTREEWAQALFILPNVPISPYYWFLYNLADFLGDSDAFLVLGAYRGICCAHVAAATNATVIGVDIERTPMATELAEDYRFTYIIDSSTGSKVRDELIGNAFPGDVLRVVFFDTEHTYEQVRKEYGFWKDQFVDGTLLLFDDVHAGDDAVMRAIDEIPGEYIPLDHLHMTLGFGAKIYRKES